ncbi:Uncharacterised protein [uncultured archaeon]|nr:Uncharacterised protein [uncultured archaeon]
MALVTLHTPADITAECNEKIAVEHMRQICLAFSQDNLVLARVHSRLLCESAVSNAGLYLAAKEGVLVIQLMEGKIYYDTASHEWKPIVGRR